MREINKNPADCPSKTAPASFVSHKIRTSILKDKTDVDHVLALLSGLDGMNSVQLSANGNVIRTSYDAIKLQFATIVRLLEQAQFLQQPGWLDALVFTCYNYTDKNIRDNATAESMPCCSNPSVGREQCRGDNQRQ
jgi:hypothetical protein